jgi:hypothetical protein
MEGGDLLLGHLDLLERRGNLLEGEVSAFPSLGDQLAQFLVLRKWLFLRSLLESLRNRL